MRKYLQFVTALGVIGYATVSPPRAFADPVLLDQAFVPAVTNTTYFMHAGFAHAQTFTVGLSGHLASVEVLIGVEPGFLSDEPLFFEILRTSAGVPSLAPGDILASGQLPKADISEDARFHEIELLSSAIPVVPGDQLAIVLRGFGSPNRDMYKWLGNSEPNYAGGGVFFQLDPGSPWRRDTIPGFDAGFRTFVDPAPVPEPGTLLLVGAGIAAGWRVRRRRAADQARGGDTGQSVDFDTDR